MQGNAVTGVMFFSVKEGNGYGKTFPVDWSALKGAQTLWMEYLLFPPRELGEVQVDTPVCCNVCGREVVVW